MVGIGGSWSVLEDFGGSQRVSAGLSRSRWVLLGPDISQRVTVGLGGSCHILVFVCASLQVLMSPGGFWQVSGFCPDVAGLGGSPWVSAGLGESRRVSVGLVGLVWSWKVLAGLGGSRRILVALGSSRQLLAALGSSRRNSVGLGGSSQISMLVGTGCLKKMRFVYMISISVKLNANLLDIYLILKVGSIDLSGVHKHFCTIFWSRVES